MFRSDDGLSPAQKVTISKKTKLFRKPEKLYDIFTHATEDGLKISFNIAG